MVILLIALILLLAATFYSIRRLASRYSLGEQKHTLQMPPRPQSLFEDADAPYAPRQIEDAEELARVKDERHKALLARAKHDDYTALQDARSETNVYDDVLNEFVTRADSDAKLLALASYITESKEGLRTNANLAHRIIELWKADPKQFSLAQMFYVAALTDDVTIYQRAIEVTLRVWRDGGLSRIAAEDLRAMIESHYWLIAPEARNSGAGFELKQTISALPRELSTPAHK
jgi:hypothetical protein